MNTKFLRDKLSGLKFSNLKKMGGNSSSKPRMQGDPKGKCLICHPNGVVMGYTVFRCSVCSHYSESVEESRRHYEKKHLGSSSLQNTLTDFEPVVVPMTKAMNKSNQLVNNNGDNSLYRSFTPCSESLHDDVDHAVNLCPSPEGYNSMDRSLCALSKEGVKYSSKLSIGPNPKPTEICSICRAQRQFSCIQKRLGKYVCVNCFRALKNFLANPQVFTCPELGSCTLTEKVKCDACWIKSCIDTYTSELDEEKQAILRKYYPVANRGPKASSVKGSSKLHSRDSFLSTKGREHSGSVCDVNGTSTLMASNDGHDELVKKLTESLQRRFSLQEGNTEMEIKCEEEKVDEKLQSEGKEKTSKSKKVFTSPSAIWKALISN